MPSESFYEPPDDYFGEKYESIEEQYLMWKTRDGNKNYIDSMSDQHLTNAIQYIKNSKSNLSNIDEDNLIKLLFMEIELLKRRINVLEKDNKNE